MWFIRSSKNQNLVFDYLNFFQGFSFLFRFLLKTLATILRNFLLTLLFLFQTLGFTFHRLITKFIFFDALGPKLYLLLLQSVWHFLLCLWSRLWILFDSIILLNATDNLLSHRFLFLFLWWCYWCGCYLILQISFIFCLCILMKNARVMNKLNFRRKLVTWSRIYVHDFLLFLLLLF